MDKIDINVGLNNKQIKYRIENNLCNYDTTAKTKSVKRIIAENFFTLFNIINLAFGITIFSIGAYKNLLFLTIIIINTLISTIQEIHAKRITDRLKIIVSPKFEVLRNGSTSKIGINEIVRDDILILSTGSQVVTDSEIVDGEVLVNESFITGESDSITKKVGDKILSGSYIVGGKCKAQVEHIGVDNYTYKISNDAKYIKKINSEIMKTLKGIIRVVSIVIIPVGLLLFLTQVRIENVDTNTAILNVIAALIGMIPEGLVLLTSTVLAVSVRRLSKANVLVQQLYSVETLARVDTLCLDKTGTITENKMKIVDVIPLDYDKIAFNEMLSKYANCSEDENSTMNALRDYYKITKRQPLRCNYKISVNSETKWSAISIENDKTYVMGAPSFLTKDSKYLSIADKYAADYRVILFGTSNSDLRGTRVVEDIEVLGFLILTDVIRQDANIVISYFYDQGIDLKVISGDNPKTVSKIAKKAGIKNYDHYIDMSNVSDDEIDSIVNEYSIFGRVSPLQKKLLVSSLRKTGRTVAMTGDGVNDVLALKEADTAIALANGSDVTKSVSELILLDSKFSSLPKVLLEGRRTINNIERSATLFISKTIYSCFLSLLFVFLLTAYPFQPIQLSLISVVTIGIPSFLLALEPNYNRVRKHFLRNIISKALPSSITNILAIVMCVCQYKLGHINYEMYSTLCVLVTATTGFCLLFKLSLKRKGERTRLPVSLYRFTITIIILVLFILEIVFLDKLFNLVPLESISTYVFRTILVTIIVFCGLNFIGEFISKDSNKSQKTD
jgi:cation-transporting ATPase E